MHSRTHTFQGHVLSDMGGFILGEGVQFRRVDAIQEAHECSAQTTLMLALASLPTSIRKYSVDLVTYLT